MTLYAADWSYCQKEILDRKAQIEETMFWTQMHGRLTIDVY